MIMMKYLYVIALVLFFSNCSKDNDEPPSVLMVDNIEFIYQDGQIIMDNDCLNYDDKYAINIDVKKVGNADVVPIQISYTVNGELMNITVQNAGVIKVNITVIKGGNTVLILNTELSDTINVVKEGDFVLVE